MKKTIAILLVAIMAVGSAFAAFSGSAQVGVGANFDNGDWGFIGNETKVTFDVDLATMNGIPIVAFESGNSYQGIQCTCSTDNEKAAQTAGCWKFPIFPPGIWTGFMNGLPETNNVLYCYPQ